MRDGGEDWACCAGHLQGAGKTLAEIAEARADLLSRAQVGKLTVEEMTGGTISIFNLGLTRVDYFTPILNRPRQAIFGLGRILQTPVVDVAGEIVATPMMGLSLTVDHRINDGALAGAFLTALVEKLELSRQSSTNGEDDGSRS